MNNNIGALVYICATPQPSVLNQAAYAALTWVQITGVGRMDEIGTNTNISNYDTWDGDVLDKAKGNSDAGNPKLEISRNPSDAGQDALRAAALTNNRYAFKIVRNDAPSSGYTGTTIYNRGLVAGPTRPQGRSEDFDLEIFTLGFVQREIIVDPTAI